MQIRNSLAEDICEGIVEFRPLVARRLTTSQRILGEGSYRDTDGVPIVFLLLQKDGYLWRLDISRVDGRKIQSQLDCSKIIALGFRQGLSLEVPDKPEE